MLSRRTNQGKKKGLLVFLVLSTASFPIIGFLRDSYPSALNISALQIIVLNFIDACSIAAMVINLWFLFQAIRGIDCGNSSFCIEVISIVVGVCASIITTSFTGFLWGILLFEDFSVYNNSARLLQVIDAIALIIVLRPSTLLRHFPFAIIALLFLLVLTGGIVTIPSLAIICSSISYVTVIVRLCCRWSASITERSPID